MKITPASLIDFRMRSAYLKHHLRGMVEGFTPLTFAQFCKIRDGA